VNINARVLNWKTMNHFDCNNNNSSPHFLSINQLSINSADDALEFLTNLEKCEKRRFIAPPKEKINLNQVYIKNHDIVCNVDVRYECGICEEDTGGIKPPQWCESGHSVVICNLCYLKILTNGPIDPNTNTMQFVCPYCKDVTNGEPFPDRFLEEPSAGVILAKCPSIGCKHYGIPKDIISHIATECKFNKCEACQGWKRDGHKCPEDPSMKLEAQIKYSSGLEEDVESYKNLCVVLATFLEEKKLSHVEAKYKGFLKGTHQRQQEIDNVNRQLVVANESIQNEKFRFCNLKQCFEKIQVDLHQLLARVTAQRDLARQVLWSHGLYPPSIFPPPPPSISSSSFPSSK
jgi:hypothetical protein